MQIQVSNSLVELEKAEEELDAIKAMTGPTKELSRLYILLEKVKDHLSSATNPA